MCVCVCIVVELLGHSELLCHHDSVCTDAVGSCVFVYIYNDTDTFWVVMSFHAFWGFFITIKWIIFLKCVFVTVLMKDTGGVLLTPVNVFWVDSTFIFSFWYIISVISWGKNNLLSGASCHNGLSCLSVIWEHLFDIWNAILHYKSLISSMLKWMELKHLKFLKKDIFD